MSPAEHALENALVALENGNDWDGASDYEYVIEAKEVAG